MTRYELADVRAIRENLNITQSEMAKVLGTSLDTIKSWETGRRTTQEKIAIVQQSFEPGMTVSLVARQHGVAASQLFLWRKQYQ
ncbi:NadS family protein, partial [Escherichia coli]|uniref:NadS family protein n=1 Tax=Escherichia coli TaxID=562 RepID=UPI003EE389A4